MDDAVQQILNETLDYLIALCREKMRPEEAMARFRILQERHRDLDLDLLWEEESYTQAVHYDALLHLPREGTVSVSFCPDRALPWPLRGAQRWHERDVVRVNGITLTVEEAMACLDFLWNKAQVIPHLVNVCLIRGVINKRAIEVSDAELQQAMDAFRKEHGLYTAEATYRWMEQHGMAHDRLERHMSGAAAAAKLRDQIIEGRVEDYFERRQADFDTAHVARIKMADEERAQRLYEQIRGGTVDFFEAAQRQFLAGKDSTDRHTFIAVQRRQVSPAQAAVIFSSSPGEVVGPVRSGEGYDIIRVLQINRACLDEPTREAVKEILFEEWLAERRQEATIEWFWGDVARMPNQESGSSSCRPCP